MLTVSVDFTLADTIGPLHQDFGLAGSAVDAKGDKVLVGAPGQAFLVDLAPDAVQKVTPLVDLDLIVPGDFGAAVAIVGDKYVVSAPSVNAFYVFTIDQTGVQGEEVTAPTDINANAQFGAAMVAYNDGQVLVAAPQATITSTPSGHEGKVFLMNLGGGDPVATIESPIAANSVIDYFGASLATDGTRILIGAPQEPRISDPEVLAGAAYLYESPSDEDWDRYEKPAGDEAVGFGVAVAFYDDGIIISAPKELPLPSNPEDPFPPSLGGTVYVYQGTSNTPIEALSNTSGAIYGGLFGQSLAVNGDLLAVSAPGDVDPLGGFAAGSVYVYDLTNLATPLQIVGNQTALPGETFGTGVAWAGGKLVASDPWDSFDAESFSYYAAGSVFIFEGDYAPMVDPIVGPATADVDASVEFSSNFTDEDVATALVRWNFGDGTVTPYAAVADAAAISASHIYATAGTYTVTLSVKDAGGKVTSVTTSIVVEAVVTDAPPTDLAIAAPSTAVRGFAVSLTGSFIDNTPGVQVSWNFGDGTVLGLGAGLVQTHTYQAAGTYTVTFTVNDGVNAAVSVSQQIVVSAAGLDEAGNLLVGGTGGSNTMIVRPATDGVVNAFVDGTSVTASPTGSIILSGGAGTDIIVVVGTLSRPVIIFGGAGSDLISGGNSSSVIVGGAGNDLIVGGSGRDVLIGGTGADVIVGNASDDILIAGTTAYDNSPAALESILATWIGGGTFTQRVEAMGLGSTALVADATVFNDDDRDLLTGNAGTDWFVFNRSNAGDSDPDALDRITDLNSVESQFAADLDLLAAVT